MPIKFLNIQPVLPTTDIKRDVDWYTKKMGFIMINGDNMYAVLKREHLYIHLQWHANNEKDPLNGGSVIKIFVKNIHIIFEEFVQRGTVTVDKLKKNTLWGTHEFGFFDLNKNAIFFVEDI